MKLKKSLSLQKVGEQAVLVTMDLASGDPGGMVVLNETGAFLCALLAEGADHETMISALTDRYAVTRPLAEESVKAFVEKLTAAGLTEP